mgnify:CR=1 FL=1
MKEQINAIKRILMYSYLIKSRKISNLMIYVTNRCNSLCKHCYIWEAKPKYDLSIETIKNALNSKYLLKSASIGLEGGEFFMHPRWREILSLMKGKNYVLLTNGIMTDLVIGAVKEFKIPKLQLSIEGNKETYKNIRGVDKYDNIMRIILELKDITKIRIAYTFTPWNTEDDFNHVNKLCEDNNLEFGYENIYSDMPLMETKQPLQKINFLDNHKSTYLKNYNGWLNKEIKMPCMSIFTRVIILPTGDVPLCQHENIILGNINEKEFDKIWSSENTVSLQKKYNSTCNNCWLGFHRGFDINYIKNLEKIIPKFLIDKMMNKYILQK